MNESQKNSNGLVSGAISLTISIFIVKSLGFLFKLPLSHLLGDEGMGYFNCAYTVFSFFYLLCSSGVPRAISILVTEATVKGDTVSRKRIFKKSINLFATIGLILTVITLIFSPHISNLIGNKNALYSLAFISPSLLIVSISGVLRGYLNGISQIVPISVSQVIEVIVKLGAGLVFALIGIRLGCDIYIISAMTVCGVTLGSLLSTLYLYIYVKKSEARIKTRQKTILEKNDNNIIKKIIRLALPLTISSSIMGISNIFDLTMIMKRLSFIGYSEFEANSLYGNYTTLVIPMLNLVVALISPITVAALPMISGAHYLKDKHMLDSNSKGLIDITAFIAIPIGFGFLFYSEEILSLLFNDSSAKIAAPLLILIVPSMIFLPLLTVTNTILEAMECTKAPLIASSIAAIIKFSVSYYLIGDHEFGISGAPLGTSISYGIAWVISVIILLKKTNISISVLKGLVKPLLFSFISLYISKAIYTVSADSINNVIAFSISVLIAVVVYLILSLTFGVISIQKIKSMSILTKTS